MRGRGGSSTVRGRGGSSTVRGRGGSCAAPSDTGACVLSPSCIVRATGIIQLVLRSVYYGLRLCTTHRRNFYLLHLL